MEDPVIESEETDAPSEAVAEYDAARDESPDERPPKAPRGITIPLRLPVVITAVVVVALLVLLFFQWRRANDLSSDDDGRTEVRTVASDMARALLTYSFETLDAAQDAVHGLATDEYAAIYDQAFTIGLEPTITQLRAVSTVDVRDVYINDFGDDNALAIVVVDSDTQFTDCTRSLVGSYLQMALVREGGDWRVNNVVALATEDQTLTPPDCTAAIPVPGETTTTTTPGG